jgi:hypothetical protein
VELTKTLVEPRFDEFEHEVYARTSDNNMPHFAMFVPLTEDERAEAEEALAL